MLFNSFGFILVLLPVFLIGYYLMQHFITDNVLAQKCMEIWLIIISICFFATFGWYYMAVFAISIVINLLFFLILRNQKRDRKNAVILGIAVAINIASLLFFKYSNVDSIIYPLAISFYTFQQIAFLVDVYRGDIEDTSVIEYLCYITFFPKVLQGPIARYEVLMPQLKRMSKGRLVADNIFRGITLFTIGLCKKVLLAEIFGECVSYGYSSLAGLTWLDAIIVAVCYSFQLYFDFSGYCDMAAGICMMMGIGKSTSDSSIRGLAVDDREAEYLQLPINFDSPYKARNIIEFWKGWHITLTRFFTKYVYIPLGGNRVGKGRMYLNFLIVFFLSGVWHGEGWNFIIWGMMHGALYVLTRMYGDAVGAGKDLQNAAVIKSKTVAARLLDGLKTALTFIYVTIAWMFFRAESVTDAMTLLGKVFQVPYRTISIKFAECFQMDEIWYVLKVTPVPDWKYGSYVCVWLLLGFAGFIIWGRANAIRFVPKMKIRWWTPIIIGCLFIWGVISMSGVSTFLYLNF